MEDSCATSIIMLICGIIFIVGVIFGMSSMYVFVPLAFIAGFVGWYYIKDPKGKRKLSNMLLTTTAIIIVTFIIVGFGSCIRSCTKGGGDLRQQRIEMTGHAY